MRLRPKHKHVFTGKVPWAILATMFPPRPILLVIALLFWGHAGFGQTVVNSAFLNRYPANKYSDTSNWSPPEVPNNTSARNYNVSIGVGYSVDVDTNATVSNLTLTGSYTGLQISGETFAVTGTTTNQVDKGTISIQSSSTAEAKFSAGTLSRFSNKTLSGNYSIFGNGLPGTLQFNGASVSTLTNAFLYLSGPLSRVVDEFGNDALLNLARLDSASSFYLFDHNIVTNAQFSNEGYLSISQGHNGTTFTAAVGLTNFDSVTRTITGGNFAIGGFDSTV